MNDPGDVPGLGRWLATRIKLQHLANGEVGGHPCAKVAPINQTADDGAGGRRREPLPMGLPDHPGAGAAGEIHLNMGGARQFADGKHAIGLANFGGGLFCRAELIG